MDYVSWKGSWYYDDLVIMQQRSDPMKIFEILQLIIRLKKKHFSSITILRQSAILRLLQSITENLSILYS